VPAEVNEMMRCRGRRKHGGCSCGGEAMRAKIEAEEETVMRTMVEVVVVTREARAVMRVM